MLEVKEGTEAIQGKWMQSGLHVSKSLTTAQNAFQELKTNVTKSVLGT